MREVNPKIGNPYDQWLSHVAYGTNHDERPVLVDQFSCDEIRQVTERILVGLTKLGLTQYQAKVYVAVLRLGTASLTMIAKECSLDRGSTFHAIEKLMEMDFLRMELGTPNLYAPRNAEKVIGRLLSRYRDELESRIKTASEVAFKAEELKRTRVQSVGPALTGSCRFEPNRATAAREFYKFLREARVEVLFVGPARLTSRFGDMIGIFKDAFERGVVFRCVTEINETNKHYAEILSKYCRIRHSQRIPMLMSIFDRKVVLFGATPNYLANSELEDEAHIVLEYPTFADAFVLLFENLWKNSKEQPAAEDSKEQLEARSIRSQR
jgi:sugar-specific transcriptional regulator TrmB